MPARLGEHRAAQRARVESDRDRLRGVVVAHAPLVAMLRELYPNLVPSINATDREVGAHIGEQRLIERLELLLKEARTGSPTEGKLPQVIHGG